MNIRNHCIEIQSSLGEINDIAQALVHSIIYFRTHGKFNYKHEGSYSIGTLGFEKAFCDHINFSYVRCSSLTLTNRINNKIQEFVDKFNEFTHSGTLSLEFYTKRPNRWPFNDTKIIWELWTIKIIVASTSSAATNLIQQPSSNNEHFCNTNYGQRYSESALKLEDNLSQKLLDIIKIVNSDKCSLPQMPTQPNLDTVFDTSFTDLQPYLYNLSYKISETAPGSHSVIGGAMSKHGGDGGTVTGTQAQSSIKKFLLGTLEL